MQARQRCKSFNELQAGWPSFQSHAASQYFVCASCGHGSMQDVVPQLVFLDCASNFATSIHWPPNWRRHIWIPSGELDHEGPQQCRATSFAAIAGLFVPHGQVGWVQRHAKKVRTRFVQFFEHFFRRIICRKVLHLHKTCMWHARRQAGCNMGTGLAGCGLHAQHSSRTPTNGDHACVSIFTGKRVLVPNCTGLREFALTEKWQANFEGAID